MKRFLGLIMALAGAGAALWGGYHVIMGQSATHIEITNNFSVSALAAGLAGVAVFTVGLVWCRD